MLKTVHVTAAALTLISFVARGIGMFNGSSWLRTRAVKIAPHVIDTVLFASAIGLMIQIHQYPGVNAWLTAKVTAVLVYIGLGEVALHYGKTQLVRALAWIGGLAVFAYIVAVALSHRPLPFFG
jgi:uncharacterized membrane protein SirB2